MTSSFLSEVVALALLMHASMSDGSANGAMIADYDGTCWLCLALLL